MSPALQSHRAQDDVELDAFDENDIERLGPPKRKQSLLRSLVEASHEYHTEPRSASLRTTKSFRENTLGRLKRWTSTPPEETGTPKIRLSPKAEARKAFIYAHTKKPDISFEALSSACEWYADHMENKIEEGWKTLLRPVLDSVDQFEDPSERDIIVSFKFLTAVVLELQECGSGVALTDICDRMYDLRLLRDTNKERTDGFQLVYAAVGWLSHLYTPKQQSIDPGLVSIEEPSLDKQKSPHTMIYQHVRKHAETTTQDLLEDCKDQPLYNLLRKFGKTLPKPLSTQDISLIPAMIKIDWVEDLGQHLEFDIRSKKLKLFKYPSLCLVLLASPSTSGWLKIHPKTDPITYYHELLLSYRLIFGSDLRASAEFSRLAPTWGSSFFNLTIDSKPSKSTHKSPVLPLTSPSPSPSKKTADPLLLILCGKHWEEPGPSEIYAAIQGDDICANYKSTIHLDNFPFLGDRLSKLENHVRGIHASTFKGMWHDRRIISQWWTLWAVIIIGGGTLILGSMSVVLQIAGLVLSKQQIDASRRDL